MDSNFTTKCWNAIYIISYTSDLNKNLDWNAINCFFVDLSDLIPDSNMKNAFQNFISQEKLSKPIFNYAYRLNNYVNLVLKRKGQMNPIIQTEDKMKEKYKNINKNIWGSLIWFLLHYLAINLPENMNNSLKITFKSFIVCIRYLLPCLDCASHMESYMMNHDIDAFFTQKNGPFIWTYEFHNDVNKRLNKPTLDFKTAYHLYKTQRSDTIYDNKIYTLISEVD